MKIFPKEIIENSAEVFKFKHTTRSKIIYSTILLSILGLLISLPFIKVDVYTSSAGIIKPDTERISLSVINSGRIKFSALEDNLEVREGDTILITDNEILNQQLSHSNNQAEEVQTFIEDLSYLLRHENGKVVDLRTAKYVI